MIFLTWIRMIPTSWIKALALSALISVILGLSYYKVKQIGYKEAQDKYELVIAQQSLLIADKIANLEKSSRTLAEETKSTNAKLNGSVLKITEGLKGKTLSIIKEGECYPNKTFSDSFMTLNATVNQNMQESRK